MCCQATPVTGEAGGSWAPALTQVSPYSGWELLERAWPEVAHIVNLVAMQQRRDAAAVGRGRRDVQTSSPCPSASS